jgi:hypothetical protein
MKNLPGSYSLPNLTFAFLQLNALHHFFAKQFRAAEIFLVQISQASSSEFIIITVMLITTLWFLPEVEKLYR